MTLRSKGLLLSLAAMLVVSAISCPNSTVVNSGNGAVQLRFVANNQGRWDFAVTEIRGLLIEPVDPTANVIAGGSFTLTPTPIAVGLVDAITAPEEFGVTHLAQGTYEMVEIEFNQLIVADGDPVNPPECPNYIPPPFTLTSFPTPLTFDVPRDLDGTVTLTFNLDALAQTLDTACSSNCSSACFTQFDANTFGSLINDFLTID